LASVRGALERLSDEITALACPHAGLAVDRPLTMASIKARLCRLDDALSPVRAALSIAAI